MAMTMKILLILLTFTFPLAASTTIVTAVSKDQIACTMCYSCENPCQPLRSPPPPPPSPPPPAECPPPPLPSPPRPPAHPECPPPPAPVQKCPTCPPLSTPIPQRPPPMKPYYEPPGSGQFYAPPGPGYGNNPVPYFPNYDPWHSSAFNSVHFNLQMVLFSIFLSLICSAASIYI